MWVGKLTVVVSWKLWTNNCQGRHLLLKWCLVITHKVFSELVLACLREKVVDRPSMTDVVQEVKCITEMVNQEGACTEGRVVTVWIHFSIIWKECNTVRIYVMLEFSDNYACEEKNTWIAWRPSILTIHSIYQGILDWGASGTEGHEKRAGVQFLICRKYEWFNRLSWHCILRTG